MTVARYQLKKRKYGYSRVNDVQAEPIFTFCPKTRKAGHSSRTRAKRHAKHLRRLGRGEVNVYQCRHCGSWHVGRDTPLYTNGKRRD